MAFASDCKDAASGLLGKSHRRIRLREILLAVPLQSNGIEK